MSVIDKYLENVTKPQRAELERVRKIVHQSVPDAVETLSYGMPAFKYNKRILIYFAAFKTHMSIFPASDLIIEAVGKKLGKFRTSKGTLQFTEDNPIPESIIREYVLTRLAIISKVKR